MHRFPRTATVSLVVALILGALALPAAAGASPRIIGGTKVDDATFASSYSSLVSIQRDVAGDRGSGRMAPAQLHSCTGTLIAPRLVLTAAHCVMGGFPTSAGGASLTVLAGSPTLSGRTRRAGVRVRDVLVHPDWSGTSAMSYYSYGWGWGWTTVFGAGNDSWDVAVLRLATPIDSVTPARLVAPGEDQAAWGAGAGRQDGVVAAGWGERVAPGMPQRSSRRADRDLRTAQLPVRSDRRCERSDAGLGSNAADFDPESMLCAGVADGPGRKVSARAVCFGDSGGPLLGTMPDGSQRVVGVASWTSDRQPCLSWSVFTRVAAVRDWIQSIPQDAGGAGGFAAPGVVRTTSLGGSSLRIDWDAAAGGTPVRYQVYRGVRGSTSGMFVPSLLQGSSLALVGTTDAVERSIRVDGFEPQRRGQHERRRVRVDAIDAAGNVAPGRVIAVDAPVDSTPPTRPGTLSVRTNRWASNLRATAATDDDCIARYVIEAKVDGRWRGVAVSSNELCDPALSSLFGFGLPPGATRPPRIAVSARVLGAGTHRVRLVAFDRAGNRSVSRSSVVTVPDTVRRGSTYSCSGIPGALFCTRPVRHRGVSGAKSGDSVPVDVVVG